MAIRQTRKISELNTLTSASLNTYVLGVDNGATYKITLDVLEDAVVNMVSRSTDLRLDALESYTSSANAASDISALNSFTSSQTTLNSAFTSGINARLQTSSFNEFSASVHTEILAATNEQSFNGLISGSSQLTSSYDSRYVISGSITQTTWDNIANKPSGIVSQSTDLSSLNTFTQSIDNRVDSLESWSSSLTDTFATDLEVSIVSSSVAATIGVISQNTGLVSTSSFNSYTASISTASLVTSITNLNTYTASQSTASLVTSINNLNSYTASISTASLVTSINNLNTYTASQSTSSLVNRLNAIESVSGSWITESETGSFLTNLNGAISASSQITAFGFVSGSYETTGRGIISSSANLVTITTFNDYTASISTASLVTSITNLNTFTASISTASLVTSITNLNNATSSYETIGRGIVSGSSQLTSSYDTRYTLSGSVSAVPSGTISGSAQITALGFVSSSSAVPEGTISGSSQLTSSLDTRYLTIGGDGVISGSSQITGVLAPSNLSTTGQVSASVFVGGYLVPEAKFTVVSSKAMTFWPNTAYEAVRFTTANNVIIGGFGSVADYGFRLDVSGSLRVWGNTTITGSILGLSGITGSIAATNGVVSGSTQILNYNILATTGSNSFNGNQTITGSLNVSSIAVVSSSFTANSSSLTLNSGSNFYLQNNGIAEITGSLLVSGSTNINLVSPVLQIGTGSGDEGGEILLAKAVTNTTLTGSGVAVDVYRDRLRLFEQGGDARGVYIDLAKTPAGVAGELMWKASGFVNAGTYVTLDNLKATLTSSGNRGLSIAAVSSNFTATYAGTFNNTGGAGGNSSNGTISVTTTPTTSLFGWNFAGQGDLSTYVLSDITNNRAYRITLQIGGSYLNNFIMIERLH